MFDGPDCVPLDDVEFRVNVKVRLDPPRKKRLVSVNPTSSRSFVAQDRHVDHVTLIRSTPSRIPHEILPISESQPFQS